MLASDYKIVAAPLHDPVLSLAFQSNACRPSIDNNFSLPAQYKRSVMDWQDEYVRSLYQASLSSQ